MSNIVMLQPKDRFTPRVPSKMNCKDLLRSDPRLSTVSP